MSYAQQVEKWREAAEASAKKVLSSKQQALKFVQKTGIVAKNGKELAKAYR